jgi:hypothetical protein
MRTEVTGRNFPWIDVELEFGLAIGKMGGQRADAILDPKGGFEIADYCFNDYRIVVELKCLEKDQSKDEGFIEKVSGIYGKYLSKGEAPFVLFGTETMTTEGLPESFAKEISDQYAIPIGRTIKKADRQLRSTGDKLYGESNWRGLLLLVNNGNTLLDPKNVVHCLASIFASSEFTAIDHVVFFTANMGATLQEGGQPHHVWYSAKTKKGPDMDDSFLEKLRECWFAHMSKLAGPVTEITGNDDVLDRLSNTVR